MIYLPSCSLFIFFAQLAPRVHVPKKNEELQSYKSILFEVVDDYEDERDEDERDEDERDEDERDEDERDEEAADKQNHTIRIGLD